MAKLFTFTNVATQLPLLIALTILGPAVPGKASTWTPLAHAAPTSIQILVQMTDGTILMQGFDGKTWAKLTPDAFGSYINGTWTTLAPGLNPAIYFASQILPDGRFWMVGGEYTGPGLLANWGNTGAIYDPVANNWTAIAPFPSLANCPSISYVSANLTSGSPIITNIYPQTAGLTVGWTVSGTGIPAGATILSVDSTTQITISAAATSTRTASTVNFNHSYRLTACFGDVPSALLPGNVVMTGYLAGNSAWLYNVATDTWSATGSKVYNDQSDEEGWAKLPNGDILTYDLFKSIATGPATGAYAELYNPSSGLWSSISPSDGTASGSIPQLSSNAIGEELGPEIRLQDGRILVIGATQHNALYDPATNTWTPGPDTMGILTNSVNTAGVAAPFGADDAPAAIVPNGHVIFAADAGPAQFSVPVNITLGSNIISNIPSTAFLQTGWAVSGSGIPSGATVASIVSTTQITISAAATATAVGVTVKFGGTFSKPTQLFDFNPTTNTISALATPLSDNSLNTGAAYTRRMLILPTGQMMFSDGGSQAYIYTADGAASPALKPVINNISYTSPGLFTLTGRQLNGQSAGAAYGDDDQMDTNYPLVRFTATDGSGHVFYAKTTNWSSVAVGGPPTVTQTVNFALNAGLITPGNYAVSVIGAGLASLPIFMNVTQAEINKQ